MGQIHLSKFEGVRVKRNVFLAPLGLLDYCYLICELKFHRSLLNILLSLDFKILLMLQIMKGAHTFSMALALGTVTNSQFPPTLF
jgi:hypothetical protein